MRTVSTRGMLSYLVFLGCFFVTSDSLSIPIRGLAGLQSVTVWERSTASGPDPYTFGVNSAELSNRLANPLSPANEDFHGVVREHYDVFYSNADGSFNLNGAFLTIEATSIDPSDSGLNISAVSLNFLGGVQEFANVVASFEAFGTLPFPSTVTRALGNDFTTHTFLGDTLTNSDPRLRLTLGFASSAPIPTPSSALLLLPGLVALTAVMRDRRTSRSAAFP